MRNRASSAGIAGIRLGKIPRISNKRRVRAAVNQLDRTTVAP